MVHSNFESAGLANCKEQPTAFCQLEGKQATDSIRCSAEKIYKVPSNKSVHTAVKEKLVAGKGDWLASVWAGMRLTHLCSEMDEV